eukprot:1830483-Rhodomonas_salina.1
MVMSKRIVCGRIKIQLVAKEDLGPMVEATFDYGYEGGSMRVVCHCGHPQCTGYINRVPRAREGMKVDDGGADNDVTVSDGGAEDDDGEAVETGARGVSSVLAVPCQAGSVPEGTVMMVAEPLSAGSWDALIAAPGMGEGTGELERARKRDQVSDEVLLIDLTDDSPGGSPAQATGSSKPSGANASGEASSPLGCPSDGSRPSSGSRE